MTNKLCEKLLNGKDQHRDIASIALKTIVAEIATQSLAQSILVSILRQLIKGITGPVRFCFTHSCILVFSLSDYSIVDILYDYRAISY